MTMRIDVTHGSLLEAEVEAIVNPANSECMMGGGVAAVILRAAGREVEREAVEKAPVPVGEAVKTGGGKTRFQAIIHAPTMVHPEEKIPVRNVARATCAALRVADGAGLRSLAMPGMGTGVGGVAPAAAAEAMLAEIRAFVPQAKFLERVVLVDVNKEMVAAWRKVLATS